jgi:hypothetical protein
MRINSTNLKKTSRKIFWDLGMSHTRTKDKAAITSAFALAQE